MKAALSVEFLKASRSRGMWATTALLVVALPSMGFGFYRVGVTGGNGVLADKARAFIVEEGFAGLVGSVSQIAAVACFLGVGSMVTWIYGREHVEGTFPALFAQSVTRRTIASAKAVISLCWIGAVSAGIVITTAILAVATKVEYASDPGPLIQLFVVATGAGLLGLTMAYVASRTRGYLPAIGTIIVIIAVSQVLVLFGVGEWFPYTVPGLLAVSGAEHAHEFGLTQLLLVPGTAALGVASTVWWWGKAEVV